jgi:hypothetical protein
MRRVEGMHNQLTTNANTITVATVAVAYDNAHWEPRPVEWQRK